MSKNVQDFVDEKSLIAREWSQLFHHFNGLHPNARTLSRSEGIELPRHRSREVLLYRVFEARSRGFFQTETLQFYYIDRRMENTIEFCEAPFVNFHPPSTNFCTNIQCTNQCTKYSRI